MPAAPRGDVTVISAVLLMCAVLKGSGTAPCSALPFHLNGFVLPFCAEGSDLQQRYLCSLLTLPSPGWGNKGHPDLVIHE